METATTTSFKNTIEQCIEDCLENNHDQDFYKAVISFFDKGDLTPIIKEELKCKIQSKRLEDGKEEMQIQYRAPQPTQLNKEDEERRAVRRQQNRDAARKHRIKKKEKATDIQHKLEILKIQNKELKLERCRLNDQILKYKTYILSLMKGKYDNQNSSENIP